ncbi:ribonuclease 3-like protein 1 [Cornus florida]|uniref:ribonuclease 3-like protein 1 n=1 Tax=Cornus florida TaxID=4283 RepID=UPI0028A2D014|nr:ribonuclease 3-like protein 1 [Cornus florida]
MEKKSSTPERFNHNLRNLPKSQIYKPKNEPFEKVIKPSPKEGTRSDEASKKADSSGTIQSQTEGFLKVEHNTNTITRQGTPERVSSKSLLYEICATNYWNPPVFECCKEEGPDHMKLFTFKVTVEITEPSVTVLECFGAPQSKKKMAAEHAAEGALWCLKNLGF